MNKQFFLFQYKIFHIQFIVTSAYACTVIDLFLPT